MEQWRGRGCSKAALISLPQPEHGYSACQWLQAQGRQLYRTISQSCLFAKAFSRCWASPDHTYWCISSRATALWYFADSHSIKYKKKHSICTKFQFCWINPTCSSLSSVHPSPNALHNPCKEHKTRSAETARVLLKLCRGPHAGRAPYAAHSPVHGQDKGQGIRH